MSGLLTSAESNSLNLDTYYAASATRTPANSTLFVSNFGQVPQAEVVASIERLFGEMRGFTGVRKVRAVCFVDFDSVKAATTAMVKFQGHQLHPNDAGLKIDYDKDKGVARKRKLEDEQQQERRIHQANSDDYRCAVCGTQALRTSGVLLSVLPTRSTDNAIVVDESKQLAELLLDCADDPVLIRRPKGIERQYRLCCRSCRQAIAYRATPTPQSFLYVLQGSIARGASSSAATHTT